MTEYGQAELSTSTLNGYKTYKKTKFMDTCENNQKLYQWALNIPDINIQQLPMIQYVFLSAICQIFIILSVLHTFMRSNFKLLKINIQLLTFENS